MTPPAARPLVDLTPPPPRGYGRRRDEERDDMPWPTQLVCRVAR